MHVTSALLIRGLQPFRGLYHDARPGHAALASDMQEEFRYLVERLVLRLVRKREVAADLFTARPGQVIIPDHVKRKVTAAFYEALDRRIETGDGRISHAEVIDRQANRLSAFVLHAAPYEAWKL